MYTCVLPLTAHVEVIRSDRVLKSGRGDKVRDVEAGLLALQHLVGSSGDLPVLWLLP